MSKSPKEPTESSDKYQLFRVRLLRATCASKAYSILRMFAFSSPAQAAPREVIAGHKDIGSQQKKVGGGMGTTCSHNYVHSIHACASGYWTSKRWVLGVACVCVYYIYIYIYIYIHIYIYISIYIYIYISTVSLRLLARAEPGTGRLAVAPH